MLLFLGYSSNFRPSLFIPSNAFECDESFFLQHAKNSPPKKAFTFNEPKICFELHNGQVNLANWINGKKTSHLFRNVSMEESTRVCVCARAGRNPIKWLRIQYSILGHRSGCAREPISLEYIRPTDTFNNSTEPNRPSSRSRKNLSPISAKRYEEKTASHSIEQKQKIVSFYFIITLCRILTIKIRTDNRKWNQPIRLHLNR